MLHDSAEVSLKIVSTLVTDVKLLSSMYSKHESLLIGIIIIVYLCSLSHIHCLKSKRTSRSKMPNPNRAKANDRSLKYNYTSCIMTRVRDVDYLLDQWFSYHIAIGVDRFIISDDCSNDGGKTMTLLEKYERMGVLTLYRRNPHLNNCVGVNDSAIAAASSTAASASKVVSSFRPNSSLHMSYMFNREKDNCHWLTSIDVDEYLFPTKETADIKFLNDVLMSVEFPLIRMLGFIMSNRGDVNRTTEPLIHRYRAGSPELFIKSFAATRVVEDWRSSHIPDIDMIWNGVAFQSNVSDAMYQYYDRRVPYRNCYRPAAPLYIRHYRSMSWQDHLIRKSRSYEATGIVNRYSKDSKTTWLAQNISNKCPLPGNSKFLPAVLKVLYPGGVS